MVRDEKTPPSVAAGFAGEVPVVVGNLPVVVSVDDLGDRGAGGGFVDKVLARSERGVNWSSMGTSWSRKPPPTSSLWRTL
jgi:hypothetical protein